jgi:hypothetical protein
MLGPLDRGEVAIEVGDVGIMGCREIGAALGT